LGTNALQSTFYGFNLRVYRFSIRIQELFVMASFSPLFRWLQPCALAFLVLALAFPTPADARGKKTNKGRTYSRLNTKAPSPAPHRYAALVIEADTGRILFEANAGAIRHPASLTKMMTLYLTFQALESGALRLDTPLPVSTGAERQSPTKLGLKAGQTIRVYDAVMGLITESANDAAVVLAEAIGKSVPHFAIMMTRQARALGMLDTTFQNPNGLPDPNQITSARDMAMLAYGLIYHFPGFYPYFSHTSFSFRGHVYRNHNNLMKRYPGMDGLKTGYIRASGFNLVASAVQGEKRLIGVVFGGTSASARDRHMEVLLDKSFAQRDAGGTVRYVSLPSKDRAVFLSSRKQTDRASWPPQTGPQDEAVEEPTNWGIQVGAFSDVETAQGALTYIARSAGSLLSGAESSIQKIMIEDGSAMYRARFIGLEQSKARATCSHLVQHGRGCLVIMGP